MTYVAVGTVTAAEIAAAVAAAEAAAAAAAVQTAAATTAAQTAAATTAAEAAAAAAAAETAAATTAASQAATAGSTLAAEAAPVAAEAAGILGATPPPGAEQIIGQAATPLTPAGIAPPGAEQVFGQAATPLTPAGATPPPPAGIEQIGAQGFSPAELQAISQGEAQAIAAQGTGMQSAGINNIGYTPTSMPSAPTGYGINAGPNPSAPGPFDIGYKPLVQGGNPAYPSTMGQLQPGVTAPIAPSTSITPPTSNSFMQGFEQFAKKNPLTTAAGAYSLASATGMLRPSSGGGGTKEKKEYSGPRLSPDFQGGPYSGPNVYEEREYNYASGGITEAYQSGGPVERMSQMNTAMNPQGGLYPMGMIDKTQYATPIQRPVSAEMVSEMPAYERSNPMLMAAGGIASIPRYNNGRLATSSDKRKDTYSATQRFLDMYDPRSRYAAPQEASDPRVGIFRDTTAATRNKSALDAAMTRQAALEEQNYVDTGANLPRASRSMGQLNLKPQGKKAQKREEYDYARGGITQANLGGYAAGGNPRLLKGPGDGMSDNIPAVIGNRQPARLADGEFVVPADVVSHLGNGSTEAGAKKLHSMMDNVRKARTGKKKQAPAVKTNKFIPK